MKLSTIVLTEAEKFDSEIEDIALQCLMMSVQSHVWHWQTKQYSCHIALGDFYDTVRDSADTIAELFMGNGNEIKSSISYDIVPFSESVVVDKVTALKEAALKIESAIMKTDDHPYHGIADELLVVINAVDKLKYLLTLK